MGSLLYVYGFPGDYIEPGTGWRFGVAWLLFSAAFSTQLLEKRRPGRFVYFTFPVLLAVEEALNFAPPDRFYASQQLIFSLLLAGWSWCLDTLTGELLARRFLRISSLPTVFIAGGLFLFPLTILGRRFLLGKEFTSDSIAAIYQTNLPETVHYFFTDPNSIFTNDLVFDLVLDLMRIDHNFSRPELRITLPEYALTLEKARTLWRNRMFKNYRVPLKHLSRFIPRKSFFRLTIRQIHANFISFLHLPLLLRVDFSQKSRSPQGKERQFFWKNKEIS